MSAFYKMQRASIVRTGREVEVVLVVACTRSMHYTRSYANNHEGDFLDDGECEMAPHQSETVMLIALQAAWGVVCLLVGMAGDCVLHGRARSVCTHLTPRCRTCQGRCSNPRVRWDRHGDVRYDRANPGLHCLELRDK